MNEVLTEQDFEKFKMDPEAPEIVDGAVMIRGINKNDKEVLPDDPSCIAKRAFDPATSRARFYIQVCTAGPQASHFYDPLCELPERLRIYKFKEVTKTAYDMYRRYLKTQNATYLRIAERE